MRRLAALGLPVVLMLGACGGSSVSDAVQHGWIGCQAQNDAQMALDTPDANRPEDGITYLDVEKTTFVEDQARQAITYTGTVDGSTFQCVWNSYAEVAALTWGR